MQATTFVASTVALVLLAGLGAAQDYDYEPSSRPSRPSGFSGAPAAPKPTPIAILKQINRHNEDGSYTYGYEGADGSFKIETKLPGGEVKGKYGYVDTDTGKVRVVEYGANRYGFQPAGEGITVAPPTLVDETTNKDGTINAEYANNGQYYEPEPAPAPRPLPLRPKPQPQQQQPQFDYNPAPRFAPAPAPAARQHAAPVPPRAQIPGAAPVEIDYRAPPRFAAQPAPRPAPVHTFAPAPRPSFSEPAPVEEDIRYAEPARRPQPQPQPAFRPAPPPQQYRPQPQAQPRPQGAPQGRSGGVLDQLARDYALPQDSAAPLHDISFGYY